MNHIITLCYVVRIYRKRTAVSQFAIIDQMYLNTRDEISYNINYMTKVGYTFRRGADHDRRSTDQMSYMLDQGQTVVCQRRVPN